MSESPKSTCPVCGGDTYEIRAKLHCRRCGMILETCCEGGPMSARPCDQQSTFPANSKRPEDFKTS